MRLPTFPDKYDAIQRTVLQEFQLDLMGPHGIPHWSRVLRNGLLICEADARVDKEVITLFALLHDARRFDEDTDIEHGVRGARFAQLIYDNGGLQFLGKERFTALKAAILGHPLGYTVEGEHWTQRTIQGCWDADRLDLGRVGIKPSIMLLGSTYGLMDGVVERHWAEAWEAEGMEGTIEYPQFDAVDAE